MIQARNRETSLLSSQATFMCRYGPSGTWFIGVLGCAMFTIRATDLNGFLQPKWFCNSMILCPVPFGTPLDKRTFFFCLRLDVLATWPKQQFWEKPCVVLSGGPGPLKWNPGGWTSLSQDIVVMLFYSLSGTAAPPSPLCLSPPLLRAVCALIL